MNSYALWRWNGDKWNFIKGVSSKLISHCSKYEIIIGVMCNPNEQGIKPKQ